MASPKPYVSSFAASEESEVRVLDSNEPLGTASSSVIVLDSNEPPVTASSSVQVLDSNEPLVPGSSGIADLSGAVDPGVAGPSGIADLSGAVDLSVAGPSGVARPAIPEDILDEDDVDDDDGGRPQSGSSGRRINPYTDELRNMWNWKKVHDRLGTEDQCIQFAEERGLIKSEKMCSHHRRPMSVSRTIGGTLGSFRCCKGNCRNKTFSRTTRTWFENVKLSLVLVFQLMYAFSEKLSYHQARKETAREGEPVVSPNTVADWYNYCRESIVVYELEHRENIDKIGGSGKVVQIDESKFGRRKYNRGRHIEGHWVLGMIEDGSDDLRLEVCPDNLRTAEILVPLIQKHVREGSIIHTDYWRAYLSFPDYGYIHK